jgi:hypothetical protein
MAGKGVKAKLNETAALDVPYFLFPALTFHEKVVNTVRGVVGLVSRRREVVPLVVGFALLVFGVTLWILPAFAVVEAVLLWDWAENDRSGKVRRNHRTKRAVQNAFIECRDDWRKEHPVKSLPLYLNHGEYPSRSDPPIIRHADGTIDEPPSFRERLRWRWDHRDEKPHTVEIMLGLPPACDDVRLGKIAGEVGKYFHATCRFQNYRNGTARLTVHHGDVLARAVPWVPMDATWQMFPVGKNRLGKWVARSLIDEGGGRSWFIFGMRGSGKSAFLNGLIARILRFANVELYIIDPLDGVDLAPWWEFAKEIAVTPEEALELLRGRLAAAKSRCSAMKLDHIEKIEEPTEDYPARIILIDELGRLTLNQNPKIRNEATYLLGELNAIGRKSADIIIAATQDPRKNIVPGEVQGQFSDRFGFHCDDPIANQTGFGTGIRQLADGQTVNVAAIPQQHQGRAWCKGGLPVFEEIRTPGLFGKALRTEVARLARQRRADSQTQRGEGQNQPNGMPPNGPDPASQASSESSPPPNGEGNQPERGRGDADRIIFEEIVRANGVGLKHSEIVKQTGIPPRTASGSIQRLRKRELIELQLGDRYTAKGK